MSDNSQLYRSQKGYDAMMELYDTIIARWKYPPRILTIPTRFGDTHVLQSGPADGIPVVAFHGWNENASHMGRWFSYLCEAHRVSFVDVIGHSGKSAPVRLPTEGHQYADWITDLLDGLTLRRPHFLGISGGGWLSVKFAARHPDRTGRLILISPAGFVPLDYLGLAFSRIVIPPLFPTPATARWLLEDLTSRGGERNAEAGNEYSAFLYLLLKHFKGQKEPEVIPDAELRLVRAPTIILLGTEERMFDPRRISAQATRLMPGLSAVECIAHAGHVIPLDQPRGLSERILSFLA